MKAQRKPSNVYCRECDMRQEAPYYEHTAKCSKTTRKTRYTPGTVHGRKVDPNSVTQRTLKHLKVNGPASPIDIAETINARRALVGSTLSYLRIKGEVANTGRGTWEYIGAE